MTGQKDASYRINYGRTLPLVASPNTGDIFFLTDPAADPRGAGIYICLAVNVWTKVGDGIAVGPTLPPTSNPGDVFIVNSGPNIGLYVCLVINTWTSITNQSYVYSGGGTVDFTDFSDRTIWKPIVGRDVTLTFNVGGSMTITSTVGTGLRTTNVNGTMAGVLCGLRLLPELVAGVPTIECEARVLASLNMGVTTGASASGDSLGGGLGLLTSDRCFCYAIGRNGFVNPNPRMFEHYANVDDLSQNALSAAQDAVDQVAATSWSIRERVTDEGGATGYRANDHYLSIDGGAYNVWKTQARLNRLPGLNVSNGLGIVVGAMWNAMLENFSVTLDRFRVTRGVIVRI